MTAIGSHFPSSALVSAQIGSMATSRVAEMGQGIVGNIRETFQKMPEYLGKIGLSYASIGPAFYALRLPFYYTEYFVHRAKNDSAPGVISAVLLFFSDVCSTFQWFDHLKVIDLGRIAESVGKIPVIGVLAKISLSILSSILFGLGHLFYAIDAIIKLAKGNLSRREEILAWLDLVSSVMQIALVILTLASCAIFPLFITVAVVAGIFTTLAFGFRYFPKLVT